MCYAKMTRREMPTWAQLNTFWKLSSRFNLKENISRDKKDLEDRNKLWQTTLHNWAFLEFHEQKINLPILKPVLGPSQYTSGCESQHLKCFSTFFSNIPSAF